MQTAHQTAGHACANPHCERLAQHGHLACRGCWFSLPDALRKSIWRTWNVNHRQHAEHVKEARQLWDQQAQRFPVEPGGCAPAVFVTRDDNRCMLLLTCYRSGQMSAAQWEQHLREEPGLREFAEEHPQ